VGDFRRMGTLLRLVGAMLVELGLRAGDAPSRQLLVRASALLQKEGKGGVLPAANQFYKQFVSDAVNLSSKQPGLDAWMYELAELLGDLGATSANYRNKDWWNDRARINVNMAAQDILLIFAWIGDRSDLLRAEIDIANDVEKAGPRSPLCRLNGQEEEHPINGAPIAYLNRKIKWDSRRPLVANLHFKLLAIAEKALLSSYLCYRDCIPDYSYAQSCIQLGELYSVTLYKLGIWSKSPTSKDHNDFDNVLKTMAEAIHFMTEYAKRFLLKAVDVLKREQEQNRNTFHLMSEAYFNLGDILLIRLLALTESADPMPCDIFSSGLQEALKRLFENLKSKSEGKAARDVYPEDLRRQIIAAYQQGLKCVQDEMNDHHSRFRVPADVYYSNRNVMDPVLHFRICRSVRLRHQGGRADSQSEEELYREFERRRRVISDLISGDESPQSFGLKHDMNTNDVPTMAWVKYLKKVVEFVNEVRTDRGPLKWTATDEGIDAMTWNTDGDAPAPHGRFVFFANLSK
jgi:hypothetical protein